MSFDRSVDCCSEAILGLSAQLDDRGEVDRLIVGHIAIALGDSLRTRTAVDHREPTDVSMFPIWTNDDGYAKWAAIA